MIGTTIFFVRDVVVAGIGDPGRSFPRSHPAGITDPGYRKKRLQHLRQIERISRRRPLVGNRFHLFAFTRLVDRPIDEARPVRSEDPRHAHDQRPLIRLERTSFPCPLRFAVKTDRPRFVLFRVRLTFLAIENIIRADMDEPRLLLRADFREHAGRFAVDCEGFLLVRFAQVHIRLRRGVDQRVELQGTERRPHLLRRREIEPRVIEADHVELLRVFAHQRRAEPAASADNHHSFHRRLI
jgi:hypothetical protein